MRKYKVIEINIDDAFHPNHPNHEEQVNCTGKVADVKVGDILTAPEEPIETLKGYSGWNPFLLSTQVVNEDGNEVSIWAMKLEEVTEQ